MRSLQTRLSVTLLAGFIALVALQLLAVSSGVPHLLESSIGYKLAEDADELYAAMNLDGRREGPVKLPDAAFITQHVDHYFEVFVGGSRVYASHMLAGGSLRKAPLAGGASAQHHTVGPDGNPLLVHAKGYESHGRQINIAVGADLTRHHSSIRDFLWRYSLLSALVVAVSLLLQIRLVRNALSFLTRLRSDLVKVQQGESPAVNERVPAEVLPLAREINQLSQTMAGRLQRSREALGNFAHAFKTPLTVLAQLAHDERLAGRPDIVRTVSRQVELLRGRVNLELERAHAAGHGELQALDLCDEVRALAKTIALIYRNKQLKVVCTMPLHAAFRGKREDLLELFGNLLDNACKYGRQRVQITVSEDPSAGLALAFEDDGPGVAPELYAQLTRHGARFNTHTRGDGFGLAIAAAIAARYGGALSFARSERLGGLRANVCLPLARDTG